MRMNVFTGLLFLLLFAHTNEYMKEGDRYFNKGKKYATARQSEEAFTFFMKAVEFYRKALPAAIDKAEVYNKIGDAYYSIRFWKKAIENYREAVTMKPDNPDYKISLGYGYWKNMMFRDAERIFDEIYPGSGLTAEQLDRLGYGYFKCNEIKKSVELIERAVAQEPEVGEYYSNLAYALQMNSYYSDDDNDERIKKEYEKCMEQDSLYLYNYVRYGLYLESKNRYYRALRIYEKGMEIDPEYYILYYYRDRIRLRHSGDNDVRREVVRNVTKLMQKEEKNISLLEAASFIYSILENGEREKQVNDIITERFPHSRIAENILYNYFLMESDHGKKVELAQAYLDKYPMAADGYLQSIYLSLFSMGVSDSLYHDRVRGWGRKMLEYTHSREHVVYSNYVKNLVERELYLDDAITEGRKGIEIIKTAMLEDKPEQYTENEWEKRLNEYVFNIKENIGWAYYLKGEYGKALTTLIEIEEERDQDKSLLCRIGKVYEKLGETDKAITYLIRAKLKKGRVEGDLEEKIKELYVAKYDSLASLDYYTERIRQYEEEKLVEKFRKQRLNRSMMDFSLENVNGDVTRLSWFRRRPVILFFWVSGNKTTAREMQRLQDYLKNHRDEGRRRLTVIGINYDVNKGRVIPFLKKYGITFPVLFGERVHPGLDVHTYPTLMVIDRRGTLQFRLEGYYRYYNAVDLIPVLLKALE